MYGVFLGAAHGTRVFHQDRVPKYVKMAADMSAEITRLHGLYSAGRFDPMKTETSLRHINQMRTRGTAAARAAEVECDAAMDETVAEYVVAGGVAPQAVLPVPSSAASSAGSQDNAGVSDVYARTLAGSRAMVGAGRATMSCYVGKVEAGPGREGSSVRRDEELPLSSAAGRLVAQPALPPGVLTREAPNGEHAGTADARTVSRSLAESAQRQRKLEMRFSRTLARLRRQVPGLPQTCAALSWRMQLTSLVMTGRRC